MDATVKDQSYTNAMEIEAEETELPGFYELVDPDDDGCIGYVSVFFGQLTFYPKAGQAFSGLALNAINEKCREILNNQKS